MVILPNSGLEEPEESFIFPKTQLINPEILIPLPYKLRIELRQKFRKKLLQKSYVFTANRGHNELDNSFSGNLVCHFTKRFRRMRPFLTYI